jgi:pyruvate/2-oxoglutarate dehydrogenase complex dihydrolipoamide dehydrogenase (E3) component
MTEVEARRCGVEFDAIIQPMREVDRAILDGEDDGFVKVLAKKGTDRILGATIVAERAGEMIGEISLAMTHGLGLKALGSAMHPYPTRSEAIRKLGDVYNRTRLKPAIRKLFDLWLKWSR